MIYAPPMGIHDGPPYKPPANPEDWDEFDELEEAEARPTHNEFGDEIDWEFEDAEPVRYYHADGSIDYDGLKAERPLLYKTMEKQRRIQNAESIVITLFCATLLCGLIWWMLGG